jgi:hypothetical protein
VRDSASKEHTDCMSFFHHDLWSYKKQLLAVLHKPLHVSPSEAVVSAFNCRGTTIAPIMTSQKLNLTPSLCLVPSTSDSSNFDEVQPHGRLTDVVLHCCLPVAAKLLNMQSSCVSVRIWCGPRLSIQP